jgi:hypothetical protein
VQAEIDLQTAIARQDFMLAEELKGKIVTMKAWCLENDRGITEAVVQDAALFAQIPDYWSYEEQARRKQKASSSTSTSPSSLLLAATTAATAITTAAVTTSTSSPSGPSTAAIDRGEDNEAESLLELKI